jgi:uncharacterized protein YyaL (SSP411 family)
LVDEVVRSRFLPNVVVAVAGPEDPDASDVALLDDRPQVDGRPTAYVCQRFLCRTPLTDPAALATELQGE